MIPERSYWWVDSVGSTKAHVAGGCNACEHVAVLVLASAPWPTAAPLTADLTVSAGLRGVKGSDITRCVLSAWHAS
jgi:hypothetical protein